jgi:peptidoglycan/xylan/chitin deacetylase (PgdA/CDA1 family)
MRFNRVLRFVFFTLLVGAVLGFAGGLVLGGKGNAETTVTQSGRAPSTGTTASPNADSTSGTAATGVASEPLTPERAKAIGANEMGEIMVLTYHLIGPAGGKSEYNRTPEDLAKDIALLKSEGYYPVNVRDLVGGNIEVPAGLTPVALTFDDSSAGQYRIQADGTFDPNSAVGVMQAAVAEGGWASRATFFPLINVDAADDILFGQPDLAKEKLQNLVEWGYEIGSYTVSYLNLKKASTAEATKELAVSKSTLEKMIGGGYKVTTLAVPFGDYPTSDTVFKGTYLGNKYTYTGVVQASGGPSVSPFSTKFRPLHITRIQVTGNALKDQIAYFKKHPELRFISDGDPAAIAVSETFASGLGGLQQNLGRPVVRYQ